jgi:DNA polymerase-1
VLATLSRHIPRDVQLKIVTGDQDAMQLVNGEVKVLRTTRGVSETKEYGREEVIEEYGVTPEQIPDYKALVGDPSDNIPGVKGIGPKGASNLLEEFATVEILYENLEKVKAKGTRKKLEEGRENAFLSLELARMRFDAPVKFDGDKLHFEGVSPQIRDVFRRYEFRSLEPRLAELPVAGGEQLPPVDTLAVNVFEEPPELSFEPVWGRASRGWALVRSRLGGRGQGHRWLAGGPSGGARREAARRAGASFDTYLAGYLVKPGLGSYELGALASERGLAEVEVAHEDPAVRDAARRAAQIHALVPKLDAEMEEMGLARLYYDVELPLADVLGEMERVGMPVDVSTLEEVGREIEGRIEELEARIFEEVGHPFQHRFSQTARGGPLRGDEHPAGPQDQDRLLDRRQGPAAARHRAPDSGPDHRLPRAGEAEGHLHRRLGQAGRRRRPHSRHAQPDYHRDGAPLQRLAEPAEYSDPYRNGHRIRDAFTASTGRKLVIADYSQIELRILAHMTGEPVLVEAFTTGEDVHTRTAAEVFDVRPESVTPELRRRAKMVNFGILYGISGFRAGDAAGERASGGGRAVHQALPGALPEGDAVHGEYARGGGGARLRDDALRTPPVRSLS